MLKDTLMCRFKFLFFLIILSSHSFAQVNTSNIEIVRDKWGIPHIYGKTDKEAAFGLAWAHAEDDFETIQKTFLPAKGLLGKLEGGGGIINQVHAILNAGIPVMGHVGLTPQSVHQFGGYKVQGKNFLDSKQIKQDAKDLQKAGVFSLVLEGIPEELAAEITDDLEIPTIGIGAGSKCDGQILVIHDLLGFNPDFAPKFVKRYAHLSDVVQNAVIDFNEEVQSEKFPGPEHPYNIKKGSLKQVKNDG